MSNWLKVGALFAGGGSRSLLDKVNGEKKDQLEAERRRSQRPVEPDDEGIFKAWLAAFGDYDVDVWLAPNDPPLPKLKRIQNDPRVTPDLARRAL